MARKRSVGIMAEAIQERGDELGVELDTETCEELAHAAWIAMDVEDIVDRSLLGSVVSYMEEAVLELSGATEGRARQVQEELLDYIGQVREEVGVQRG